MKTRPGIGLFYDTRATKKQRARQKTIDDFFLTTLPREIWLEIIKYLDKLSFRELTQACSALNEFGNHYQLFLNANWPALNYNQKIDPIKITFKWDSMSEAGDYGKPKLFTLDNGDIAAGLYDGRLFVLKLGSDHWIEYGKHQVRRIDGKWVTHPVMDVILLRSGDIASCAVDGVRIWDRKVAKLKYYLKLPGYGAWSSRPCSLLELSNQVFATGCWDGSVHLWRLNSNLTYEYSVALPLGDDKNIHGLQKLIVKDDELIGEYYDFIIRWNWKNCSLADRIEIDDIKNVLIHTISNQFRANHVVSVDKTQITLIFDWNFPNLYASVLVKTSMMNHQSLYFLINPFDKNIKPLFLGFNRSNYSVTDKNDIVYLDVENNCVRYGWSISKNLFTSSRPLTDNLRNSVKHHICYNGCVVSRSGYQSSSVLVFNPYQGFEEIIPSQIQYPYYHTTDGMLIRNYTFFLTPITAIASYYVVYGDWLNCNLKFLVNGDLLDLRSKRIEGDNPSLHEDEINVIRFGLRK